MIFRLQEVHVTQVRFLSPEGQFSWGTRVWEHRLNPSLIKQAGRRQAVLFPQLLQATG